jgi:hypothetical protein
MNFRMRASDGQGRLCTSYFQINLSLIYDHRTAQVQRLRASLVQYTGL